MAPTDQPDIQKLNDATIRASSAQTLGELSSTLDLLMHELVQVQFSALYLVQPETGQLRMFSSIGLTPTQCTQAEATAMERHPGHVPVPGFCR